MTVPSPSLTVNSDSGATPGQVISLSSISLRALPEPSSASAARNQALDPKSEAIEVPRRKALAVRHCNGGLLWCPSSWPGSFNPGTQVRLMSPEYVRPYVKAQKNDDRDAEAIAEAATRPTMRFVALKSEEQLDMQTLHRTRDRAVGERTSLMNQLRAILLERGVIVPQGRARLRLRVTELLRQSTERLSSRIRLLIEDMLAAWQALDERIAAFDAEFAAEAKRNESARRLTSIPGIGALNATALVAAVGDAQTLARGRDLVAWLGLVPRQATTGGKPRLLGITKRGSKYLRKMLIQGARAALPTLSRGNTRLGQWLRGLLARAHSNTVVVALAAKMARIVWALLRYGTTFEPQVIAV